MKLNEITNKLDDLDITYEVERGSNYSWITLRKGLSIEVKHREPERVRGAFYPSSAGDAYESILKITDSEANQPLLKYLKQRGYRELNHWHCAQWGTWKFALGDMFIIKDIYENFYEM